MLEIRYCAPRGIPHSTFADWSAHDRDAALSWLVWHESACRSCGTRPEDWDLEHGGHPHAYEPARRHCRGCEVTAQGEDQLEQDRRRGTVRRGTTLQLTPTRPEEVPDAGDSVDQG